MKRLKQFSILAILALVTLVLPAHAQTSATRVTDCSATTPNNAICVTVPPVTSFSDGTPVNQPVTYRSQQRLGSNGAWADITTQVVNGRLYVTGLAPGSYEFRVFANCTSNATAICIESTPSNVAGRAATAPVLQPSAPVITIAVVIGMDHAPVYRVTKAGERDQRYNDACGFIEVGKPCEESIAFTFRGSKFRRVAAADVKPWGVTCGANVVAPCS